MEKTLKNMTLEATSLDGVRRFATVMHDSTGCSYDGESYTKHLKAVEDVARTFQYLLPDNATVRDNIFSACWCHDLIEDCRVTYNDLCTTVNETVAELVYAVTNEKGKNRAERANKHYYRGIRNTPFADYLKLCDRIANFSNAVMTDNKMVNMYLKDHEHFCNELFSGDFQDMFDYLDALRDVALIQQDARKKRQP